MHILRSTVCDHGAPQRYLPVHMITCQDAKDSAYQVLARKYSSSGPILEQHCLLNVREEKRSFWIAWKLDGENIFENVKIKETI